MTPEAQAQIGRNLRALRRAAGLGQKALGASLGRSAQAIGNYERGRHPVTAAQLVAIADALHAPVSAFFEGV